MEIIRKDYVSEVKASDDAALVIEHFISTEHPDRMGDIVRANGMRVKGRVVVLLGHGRSAMGTEPIAKPLSIGKGEFKGEKGIIAKTQFFPDEIGKRLYAKAKDGFMPNWSIGFMISRAEDINGGQGRDIKEWDLLEYSLVGVPANPMAQTPKDAEESLSFKCLSDGEECSCGGACKGEDGYQCAGHKASDPTEEVAPSPAPEAKEEPSAESHEARVLKLYEEMDARLAKITESIAALSEAVKNIPASIAPPSLPAAPEAGAKGEEAPPSNPPEEKHAPRLVIVREEPAAPADPRAAVRDLAREVVGAHASEEIRKLLGKVP